ncbi:xanthine dehydrogenase accessory protein XdhC [Mameliella alba]|uniref:Xanthine dehydrogenase accessory protein XdhC n=1 Tax=Mameliella alba TaxID=561184 RepID=A0A0B3RTU4_9RHOB|nr:xanthine dehydrogenase accessory protein XdhC [Mameliella alba]KHQ51452.1 Xanthine dehydrogenase accessory protein XdhC [Mameliella alba]
MASAVRSLAEFLGAEKAVVRVELSRVRGSSPRGEGTEMFVAAAALWGTIGGGQLEYRAIETAREMLRDGDLSQSLDLPLGPEIGQCCGGRVEMTLTRMRGSDMRAAIRRDSEATETRPHVYVLGAGHVGRALADQLQHLPVHCVVIDTRPEEIALCSADVDTRVRAIPEIDIMTAPAGSAFIVLTHDHALDFLLASSALERGDAAYVGMIGSATKRVKFKNWMRRNCESGDIDKLICPIGASGSRDKRPSLIAAFVVAEVMAELTSEPAAAGPRETGPTPRSGHHHDQRGMWA